MDFRQIVQSDQSGDSNYVVGGRAYFEGSIFGLNLNSFTYKGFFDEQGYQEPKSTIGKLKHAWVWVMLGLLVVIIAVVVILYFCCRKSKSGKSKVD